ncbi:MAG: uroporphyrinogen-III C-methyltransferase [Gammaproteobacteria bacterium]|nr:uroporphyrinogen-III C-methyltransferase [Gammaproteobacteria bacterium]
MRHFPAFIDLHGRRALVVGAGSVAARKIVLLERSGALITVVAPQAEAPILEAAAAGRLIHWSREFRAEDLDGATIVVVATPRRALNRWIAKLCDARGVPVNVVDDAAASRFIVPAIVDRDPVLVAVSTGGASPVLARRLRERLEAALPVELGRLALWLASLRRAARRLRDGSARRRFYEALIDGPAARRLLQGDRRGADRLAARALADDAGGPPPMGEVLLVGAGPGDPELLTLKALRALQDADVILHDRLVSDEVLELARRDALRIPVGKTGGGRSTSQEAINALLIEHARLGRRVVRLKGGDPFVFGRGGEELEALAGAGIRTRVIPGITAALGAAAAAAIPLTHRDCAHEVSFVTAQSGDASCEPDWRALAAAGRTVVFYMGTARIAHIAAMLVAHGAPATRPVALIAAATRDSQRIVTGSLHDIHDRAMRAGGAVSPALLVVGEVVSLHQRLETTQTVLARELAAIA